MTLQKLALTTMTIAIAVVVVACSADKNTNASFLNIPSEGWAYGDTLSFESPHPDSITVGNLAVTVRHTNSYQYSNLWLEITTPLDSVTERIDTVNILLANIYGKWYSRGIGASYVTTDTLPDTYIFERHRPTKVRHIMRADTINEIEQIGIILIENK